MTDTGYQGIQKLYHKAVSQSCITKLNCQKKGQENTFNKEDKKGNQELASERLANKNLIAMIKRFKIISDKYGNRRKKFGLRFNPIAAIYIMDLMNGSFPKKFDINVIIKPANAIFLFLHFSFRNIPKYQGTYKKDQEAAIKLLTKRMQKILKGSVSKVKNFPILF